MTGTGRVRSPRWRVLPLVLCTLAGPIAVPAFSQPFSLAGSEWSIEFIAGGKGKDGVEPLVRFGGDGEVAGNSGCNDFRGRYRQDGDIVEIGPLASTKKVCLNDGMDLEYRFLEALEHSHRVTGGHLRITIFARDGRRLLDLRRQDWD